MEAPFTKDILRLCADIPRTGRLQKPDGTATQHARLCGSSITVDVKLDPKGRIAHFAQDAAACDALGKAAASLLARHVLGKSYDDLKNLRDIMHKMLEQNGPPPQGEWADFKIFESLRAYPERHASTLLPFDATAAAVENALDRHARAGGHLESSGSPLSRG